MNQERKRERERGDTLMRHVTFALNLSPNFPMEVGVGDGETYPIQPNIKEKQKRQERVQSQARTRKST
ncbi:hypothetical protein BDV27DRAFT_122630 [Aspergillus caelatus]|uniref:Uncharacterized protein n=1 Tax=Aspergillus caelatus TaxID=61420 RepID=A0A5N7AE81_9EURO|nr:uncharacterized protein BDV27DRAFT_122630 [Aspergillus caelatus]KAE8368174.1 hypothetical protein BDV27DRAFT_122630 [Aspergillus caelatus]